MKVRLRQEASIKPVRLIVRMAEPDMQVVKMAAASAGLPAAEFIRQAVAEKLACSSQYGEVLAA